MRTTGIIEKGFVIEMVSRMAEYFEIGPFSLFPFYRCVHVGIVSLKACHAAVFVYRVAVTNGCPRGIT